MKGTAPETIETAMGPVEVARAGSGPPVLLVHGSPGGWDSSMAMGRFIVEAGFELIAPSRPGYPGTELGSITSIDQQADLHAALLDSLGIDRVGVLSWSGGGPSSYRLAVLHPEKVDSLVAFASVSRHWEPEPAGIDERLIENTSFGNWILRFLANHAPRTTISSTLAAEGDLSKSDLKALVEGAMEDEAQKDVVLTMAAVVADHANRARGLANDYARFAEIDSLELNRITAPTLVIHGTSDADVPLEHGEFAARTIEGAVFAPMENGTHLSLFVHPECLQFQDQVSAFFSP